MVEAAVVPPTTIAKFKIAQLATLAETVGEPKTMTEDAKYGRSAITDEPFESLKARFLETVSRATALPPAALRGRV